MKKVRNLLLAVSLVLASNMVTANKANAGLLLAPATGGISAVMVVGQGVIIGSTGAKFLGVIGYMDTIKMWGLGLLLIALDEEVENNISATLAARYPMISDQSIFEELAEIAVDSNDITEYKYGVIDVKLNESIVRDVLDRLDTTGIESKVEELVSDLI
jgi:hypothetical protein